MASIDELIVIAFNHPLTYIIVLGAIVYLVIKTINQGKLKPEQKPDFGVKYRAKRTKDHLEKRSDAFGFKPEKKTILYYGYRSLGKVLKFDEVNITHRKKTNAEQLVLKVITYRRFGLGAFIKSYFGRGRQRIIVDETVLQEGEEKIARKRYNTISIPSNAFFRERGGILFLSKDAEKQFIDEINADADYENAKGFVSDFPRRLSNLHPAHAANTDTLELEENLEEKKRKSFVDRFKRGG